MVSWCGQCQSHGPTYKHGLLALPHCLYCVSPPYCCVLLLLVSLNVASFDSPLGCICWVQLLDRSGSVIYGVSDTTGLLVLSTAFLICQSVAEYAESVQHSNCFTYVSVCRRNTQLSLSSCAASLQSMSKEMLVLKPGNACASSLQLYCVSGHHNQHWLGSGDKAIAAYNTLC